MVMRPKSNYQGKAIVTRCGECDACQEHAMHPEPSAAPYCNDAFIMLPDGQIEHASTACAVEKKVRAWFKAAMHDDTFNVGLIEWRAGLKPADRLPKSCGGRRP